MPDAETNTNSQAQARTPTIARATLSKYFNTLSGSVDGLNFAATEYGTVMRSEPVRKPRNPTPGQLAQENRVRLVSRGWGTLSAASVAEFRAWAGGQTHVDKAGRPFTPNGYQAYSALALGWYAANGENAGAPPTSPPAGDFVAPTASIDASATSGLVSFAIDADPAPGVLIAFRLQRLRNANRLPAKGGYRLAGYTSLANGGITASFAVDPGAYAAEYRFVDKATGQRTALVAIKVSGVALALETGGADVAPAPASRKKAA